MQIDWISDLDQLGDELPKLHKKTFSVQEKADFAAHIDALKERQSKLDTYTIATHIASIVATIGDAHTTVLLPKHSRLPFECYWFKEGIYITAAMAEFENLRSSKVIKIEGVHIDEVVNRLSKIISHENQSFLMSQLPGYLICADILYGVRILDDGTNVRLTLQNNEGEQYEVVIPTIEYDDNPVLLEQNDSRELPLYLRNIKKYFWSEFDEKSKMLYINYNHCKDMEDSTVSEFTNQNISDIEDNPAIAALAIDLRKNGGGNSELLKDFLNWLSSFKRLNKRGNLFVIVGRDTFSSALLNVYYLKQHTQAIFVGEPTGGKPNCYGEVKYLSLNSSGLYIRYSTKYYDLIGDNEMLSFMPDKLFDVTFKDFAGKKDPCMDWVRKQLI